ncbi:MAG TPA: 50S ribosomal protein L1 [Pirellulaceae bacterium]|nr:50S ribosomal protein L1 [Pirellulaceae bacterium]HMO92483.1 50S ribosomal protein L1 [Pirellulaceae bacterium]HMP67847.1 50S ribosomal protein L1 [Pirellulaceae bacterium]
MVKRSKRYRQHAEKVPGQPQDLSKAVSLLKEFGGTKFEQSVEVHMRLGIDAKQADQLVRGSIVLPHGIGKSQRVVVFAKGENADAANSAGADFVGQQDLAEKIKGGWLEFDVCIATPDMMGVVGPLGKVLGPRGLMPSPRAGTVTPDVATAVSEYKAGKVEFRNDSGGNVHAIVGRLSFTPEQLQENIRAFIRFVESLKPNSIKGNFIKGIHIAATMSPGIQIAA